MSPKKKLKVSRVVKRSRVKKKKVVERKVKKPSLRKRPRMVVSRKALTRAELDNVFPIVSVFGHRINPKRIRSEAVDLHRKKTLTTDDIRVEDFIKDENYDNLMVKIAILDHIEEHAVVMYPGEDIARKNRLTLEIAK